jgi:HEPN domain-containing protein
VEFLGSRALRFLEQATYAYQKGYNELALFNIEQYFQLYTKYLLYKQLGEYQKTHTLKRLLEGLAELYRSCGISEHVRENSLIIGYPSRHISLLGICPLRPARRT